MPFHAIAAMSENRVIGNKGKLPWHLPEEYRWFKHKTMGGTLIMGRKTFESIGKALPGRKTIVLTRQPMNIPGVEICADADLLIKKISDQEPSEKVVPWICGGVEIYQQFLPNCSLLYLTRIKRVIEGDAFFPPFEETFSLDQIIHENTDFRVERWKHKNTPGILAPEPWPFPAS